MEKLFHNKKQNTGLIFELLSQQVVSSTIDEDSAKFKKALYLIKKYFKKGSMISEELSLINSIIYSEVSKWQTASKLLSEVIEASKKIDQKVLREEKHKLATDIAANFDKNKFYNAKVPNYSVYASIYSLIENARRQVIPDVKQKIRLEETVINHLLDNTEIKRINEFVKAPRVSEEPIDDLTFHFVIKKFNKKYEKTLTESQKEILREYIRCTSQKFDRFTEKTAKKIESELYEGMKVVKDKNLLTKLFESMQKLTNISGFDKEKKAEMLMTYQQLVDELQKYRQENN